MSGAGLTTVFPPLRDTPALVKGDTSPVAKLRGVTP